MSASTHLDFQRDCLKAHNYYRRQHGCPVLRLNEEISEYSQKWAQTLAQENRVYYSNGQFGENIYMSEGRTILGFMPVKYWYDQVALYSFEKSEYSTYTESFTQLIWLTTRQLGVGVMKRDNRTFVVANYYPPGNIFGRFHTNVPPKLSENYTSTERIDTSTSRVKFNIPEKTAHSETKTAGSRFRFVTELLLRLKLRKKDAKDITPAPVPILKPVSSNPHFSHASSDISHTTDAALAKPAESETSVNPSSYSLPTSPPAKPLVPAPLPKTTTTPGASHHVASNGSSSTSTSSTPTKSVISTKSTDTSLSNKSATTESADSVISDKSAASTSTVPVESPTTVSYEIPMVNALAVAGLGIICLLYKYL